ncbi:hypothetical protein [Candidatus Leptofilum sp.]
MSFWYIEGACGLYQDAETYRLAAEIAAMGGWKRPFLIYLNLHKIPRAG